MIYINILFCLITTLSSFTLLEAAADNNEMDEIVQAQNPPVFQDFFKIGTLGASQNAHLVLWNATIQPSKINIHIVSGHPNFIERLKQVAVTDKVEQNEEQKLPTIQDLIHAAGKGYAASALNKKSYAKRVATIQKVTKSTGFADIDDDLFISCPDVADIAVKMMAKYPANDDKNDFSLEHFETLLKEDQYQGPYVIVQKEKSLEFLKALTAMVKTGGKYSTEWGAVEVPQKSITQQFWEYIND